MTSATQPEMTAVPPATPTPDAFFEHVRYSNPFAANRVVPSSALREDAEQVHRGQFNTLTDLATRSQREQLGIGVMLWGEAGVGKSHLLARLGGWAGAEHKHAIFVYLANLQAQPEQLPRSLLKCVVSILTRGRTAGFADTPLFRVVNAAVGRALRDDGGRSYTWSKAEAAYVRLVDGLCGGSPARAALVDRPAYGALFRFFRSAYLAREGKDDGFAALAIRWLSGDALDPDEARALGLTPPARREETVALADDEQIKRVLVALAQTAGFWGRPFVFCFDQADNLEPEQFASLSRFLQALLDSATNLLVITSGVRDTIMRWEADHIFTRAAFDRLGQYEIELQRVGIPEARQIVQARLQRFQEPFLTVPEVKELVQRDYLFPLGERWAESAFAGKVEVRPRDVINWAREGWRRQQDALRDKGGSRWLEEWGGVVPPPPPLPLPDLQALIDAKVDLKLQEHRRQRQLEPQTLPPDADNLAGLLYSLLQRCLNDAVYPTLRGVERLVRPRYGQRPPYDMTLRQQANGAEARTGLLCLVVSNKTSMSGFLRRLMQDAAPPGRLFLVTDERCPLEPAAAGREYLQQLRDRAGNGFRHVDLTFDQYAELDALQAVVGLARSGDLEIELPNGVSRRVTEEEVVASHKLRRRYLDHPLLRELVADTPLPPPPPPPPPPPDLDERDRREFIVGRLAIAMGCSTKELAVAYRDYLLRKKVDLPEEECRRLLEETARKLHEEGKVNATPQDDYLFLLLK